jgi:hypothetical protein
LLKANQTAALSCATFIAAVLAWLGNSFRLDLTHDFTSYLLVVRNMSLESGGLYRDFWDIKPPLLYAQLWSWVTIFGSQRTSLLFYSLLLHLICFFSILETSKWIRLPRLFSISIFSFFFVLINNGDRYLESEFQALTFQLLGLALFVRAMENDSRAALFGAAFFLLGAGFVKDPFLLAFLAVTAAFLKKQTRKWAFLGALACAAFVVLIIFAFQSVHGFMEIQEYKQQAFGISPLKFLSLLPVPNLPSLWLKAIYLSAVISTFVSFRARSIQIMTLSLFIIGSLAGYHLQNRAGAHYDIQLIPIYTLAILIALHFLVSKIKSPIPIQLPFVIFVSILTFSVMQIRTNNLHFSPFINHYTEQKTDIDKLLPDATEPIFFAYGWGAGTVYVSIDRRPNTRFFLLHPFILNDHLIQQFVDEFNRHIPKVIFYSAAPQSVDFDLSEFEKKVPLGDLIRNCYQRVSPEIFKLENPDCRLSANVKEH